MKLLRILGGMLAFAAVLGFVANSAQARSSGNRNNRNDGYSSGPRRLINPDDENDKQKEEEKRKKEEEAKKLDQQRKQQAQAAKKAAAPKPQPAKQAVAQKPKAAAPAKKPAKAGNAQKTDDDLEKEADKLRAQADAAFDKGELMPGVKLLRQLTADYDGTSASKSAQDQLDLLLGTEPYGAMILSAEGDELFGEQHYRRAWNKYRALLARFPKSDQADAARKRLAEIDEGDLLSKSVYTEEELEDARLWFLAGNIHLENGRKPEAADAYRKVIEDYPGCHFANLAKGKLPETQG